MFGTHSSLTRVLGRSLAENREGHRRAHTRGVDGHRPRAHEGGGHWGGRGMGGRGRGGRLF